MKGFKKRLGAVLAVLMVVVTCFSSMPVHAAETLPRISFVGIEHSPLMVGDTETFTLTAVNADKVQYRAFIYTEADNKWEEITDGYSEAVDANLPFVIKSADKFQKGKYKLSFWVKKADTTGKHSNKHGDYDSYYVAYLNCVEKQEPETRIYTDGDMDIARDTYVVGQKVVVNGIKNIKGMPGPYKYKLHLFNNGKYGVKDKNWNGKGWYKDVSEYGDKIEWTPSEEGTYVLDVWAKTKDSKAKYNGWKLKTINVVKGTVLSKDGEVFGSEDKNNPKIIEDNLYVEADKVTLKNLKVNGTIFIDPGKDGEINLDNVEAKEIKVLSGGKDSVHLKDVKAGSLIVSSSSNVRVAAEGTTKIENTYATGYAILDSKGGSLGKITISKDENGETVVELRGTFNEPILVKGAATIKAAAGASVSKVEIATSSKDDVVVLDGKFNEVVVNSEASVKLAENAYISTLTINANTNVEAAKGASVATVNDNGYVVEKTGEGKDDIGKPTTGGSTGGGGYYPPTSKTPEELNSELHGKLITLKNSFVNLNSVKSNASFKTTTNGKTTTVEVTVLKNQDEKIKYFYDVAKTKINNSENRDSAKANIAKVMNNVFDIGITVNNQDLMTYMNSNLSSALQLDKKDNYEAFIVGVSNKELNDILSKAKSMIDGKEFDIKIHGLAVNKVTVKDAVVYNSTSDKSVTVKEVKDAIGYDGNSTDITLNILKAKGASISVELEGGYIYELKFAEK